MGIDPGTAETGFGIISCESKKITLVKHGLIKTSSKDKSARRLQLIFSQIVNVFKEYEPDVLAIESLFFSSNALSASAVGQAIGVAKLAAAQNNLDVLEYPPLKIKNRIVGKGRAQKSEVQACVKKILKLKEIPRPNHAADALAVAICHWACVSETKERR